MSALKRLGGWLLGKAWRIVALALALTLAAALYPYARDLVRSRLPRGKYTVASEIIRREMRDAGDLVALRHTEEGVMDAGMEALIVGRVNSVRAPYAYEIGLGFSLRDVEVTPGEDAIRVDVPDTGMVYDTFRITGDPEISDFWQLMGESDYQRLVDGQAASCRQSCLESAEIMERARQSAREELQRLFSQWTGETLNLVFTQKN